MAEQPAQHENTNQEALTTISGKVPRWVEDIYISVASDADLDESRAYRITLTAVGEFLQKHWRKGPALSSFLSYLKFDAEQYNKDFLREQGK